MYRRKNTPSEDSTRHVFTEIIAAVVFFIILILFVQQLRCIEVFEQAKVRILQDYLSKEIRTTFIANGFGDRVPQDTVNPNSPLIQKIIMTNNALRFNSGDANFQTKDDAAIIDLIGKVLEKNHEVIEALKVEGHTDIVPIRTSCYPSNWELSSARAATIVHRMTEKDGFPPEKFRALAFPNTTLLVKIHLI